MPTKTITVTPFNGSLLTAELLTADPTLLLSSFGTPASGTLADDDGTLSQSDDGIATFEGQPLDYLGAGTIQPGVEVLGVLVPLGPPVPVVLFNAGGQTYAYYPDGAPDQLTAVVAVLDVDPGPVEIFPNPYVGDANPNVFFGDGFDNVMLGFEGDDRLRGANGDDSIAGHLGRDVLHGERGDDTLAGGGDDDVLFGGEGADSIDGGLGIDHLRYDTSLAGVKVDLEAGTGTGGEAEGDTIVDIEKVTGTRFADVLSGSGLDETLSGRDGDDRLIGGDGSDRLAGEGGADMLMGSAGEDTLLGGTLDDELYGGTDSDRLFGGGGSDTIDGGTGDDLLYGSTNADRFVFREGTGRDVIMDFQAGLDEVALSGSLWNGSLSAAEVASTFGRLTSTGAVLDFGEAEIVIRGVRAFDLDDLADSIAFV